MILIKPLYLTVTETWERGPVKGRDRDAVRNKLSKDIFRTIEEHTVITDGFFIKIRSYCSFFRCANDIVGFLILYILDIHSEMFTDEISYL